MHSPKVAINEPERNHLSPLVSQDAVKQEWRAQGRRPEYAEASEIGAAANAYFAQHREELIAEARNHPALL
jgi:hypothetical protein